MNFVGSVKPISPPFETMATTTMRSLVSIIVQLSLPRVQVAALEVVLLLVHRELQVEDAVDEVDTSRLGPTCRFGSGMGHGQGTAS